MFKVRVKILKHVRNGLIVMICPGLGRILLSSLLPVAFPLESRTPQLVFMFLLRIVSNSLPLLHFIDNVWHVGYTWHSSDTFIM
jgi:hypothetical protein